MADEYRATKPTSGKAEDACAFYWFLNLTNVFGFLGREQQIGDYVRHLLNNPGDKTCYARLWERLPDLQDHVISKGAGFF